MEAKARHTAPLRDSTEEPPSKKARKEESSSEDNDVGFGFNNPIYSNHKIIIKKPSDDGETQEVLALHADLTVQELVHVSKLNCSAASRWFKTKMLAEAETVIELGKDHTIEQMKDLLRWMYVKTFTSSGPDLLAVMDLATTYGVDKAAKQCATELAKDMTLEHACAYLAQEKTKTDNGDDTPPGFQKLWMEAAEFVRKEFSELSIEVIASEKFLSLSAEGLKALLMSETVRIGTENTIFTAFRLWIHKDFDARKQFASLLLPHIRFSQLRQDYLLDVVKKEGELAYPEDAKKMFARKIIEAYVYHTTSSDRRGALKLACEVPRQYDELLQKETFFWKIDNFAEQKELWSEPFFLGGYFLHLLMQRKNATNNGGGTLGLYLHIKDAGLSQEFFVPLAFELLVKNQRSGKYVSPKGAYSSPFTQTNKAWGYVDILNTTWDDFWKDSCPWKGPGGSLEVKANVWFKDYWDKVKNVK